MYKSTVRKNYLKDLIVSLPEPQVSDRLPKLADAVNLAIQSARQSAESALLLVDLSKEMPEISSKTLLAAKIASDAATYAASVASVCMDSMPKGNQAKWMASESNERITLDA